MAVERARKTAQALAKMPAVISVGCPCKYSTKHTLLLKTEPEYSEEARTAKVQGTVVPSVVVTASGEASNIRIIRSLGLGFDERVIDAVRQWKFRAATREWETSRRSSCGEVNFRLL